LSESGQRKSGAATGGINAAPDDGEVVNQILEVSKCLYLYLIANFLMHCWCHTMIIFLFFFLLLTIPH